MYLLQASSLFALMCLFVQAFVGWIFVAVFSSVREPEPTQRAFRSFRWAFAALALGLSVLSVRFLFGYEASLSGKIWDEGQLAPRLCYAVYMASKTVFGLQLIRGAYQLGQRREPWWLRGLGVPAILAMGAIPFVFVVIDHLLVVQAPVLVACAFLALRALPPARVLGSGARLVRLSLRALAATWAWHALVVFADVWLDMRHALSFNSFLDLGVQVALGLGLIVTLQQEAHRRLVEVEHERERLRRSLEKDERLRALGTVVSGVAHELNNPLTVILGYASSLEEAGRGAVDDEAARIIREQAERCRGIVRDPSALSGQSVHPPERIDFHALARRVSEGLARHRTQGREIRVRADGDLDLHADRIGLEQVLTNLVENALQASPPGGRVLVTGRRSEEGFEITVEDDGPGVPPENRDRLFEPFFTTKSPGEGTGLGLSIAHSIVQAHGGSLSVEERPVGGALFRVLLPPLEEAPKPSEPPTVPEGVEARLLVVDDDAGVRRVVRRHAEARGWQVTTSASAEAALELDLETMDAIVCDLRMRGMGGIGFHDRLLERSAPALERVVFFTGDLASDATVRFAQRCSRPLLSKPLDYDELFRELGTAAASRPAEIAPPRAPAPLG